MIADKRSRPFAREFGAPLRSHFYCFRPSPRTRCAPSLSACRARGPPETGLAGGLLVAERDIPGASRDSGRHALGRPPSVCRHPIRA